MSGETNENGFRKFNFKTSDELLELLISFDLFNDKTEALSYIASLEESFSFHNPTADLYHRDEINNDIIMHQSWKAFCQGFILGFSSGVTSMTQAETDTLH